ncbi:POTRA domain-containing protein [Mariprofundus sp. KV]|uniref:POTRA domain-containing protein n=1 Tax=Mariprofundus sp. KV TaxID=2608715 RepID=UPI0015A3316D|nr:POTRA domain-containing protein [Mariprofundus sp. KV]NWF36829.1 hypothetical protein [Mariprofundus sp. KV]
MLIKKVTVTLFGAVCLVVPFFVSANATSPTWLDEGWRQIEQNQHEAAIAIWQEGVNRLPDKQLLGSLGFFSEFANALERLKLAGRQEQVFIIHDPQESRGYHLLTAQEVLKDIHLRQIQLAALKQRTGMQGKLLANESRKFKSPLSPEKLATIKQQTLAEAAKMRAAKADAEAIAREEAKRERSIAALKQQAAAEATALKKQAEAEAKATAKREKAEAAAKIAAMKSAAQKEAAALKQQAEAEAKAAIEREKAEAAAKIAAMKSAAQKEAAALKQQAEAEAKATIEREKREAAAKIAAMKRDAEIEAAALKQQAEAEAKAAIEREKREAAAKIAAMKRDAEIEAAALKQQAEAEAKAAIERQEAETAIKIAAMKRDAEIEAAALKQKAEARAQVIALRETSIAEKKISAMKRHAEAEAKVTAMQHKTRANSLTIAMQKKAEAEVAALKQKVEREAKAATIKQQLEAEKRIIALEQQAEKEAIALKQKALNDAKQAASERQAEAEARAIAMRERAEAEANAITLKIEAEARARASKQRARAEAEAAALKKKAAAQASAGTINEKKQPPLKQMTQKEQVQQVLTPASVAAQKLDVTVYETVNPTDTALKSALIEAGGPQEWINDGWHYFEQQDYATALLKWQRGLNGLNGDRLLATLGAFSQLGNAVNRLQKIGPDHNAIIIRSSMNGRDIYYVLSATEVPVDIFDRQEQLKSLKKAAGISGFLLACESKKFRSGPISDNHFANIKLYRNITPTKKVVARDIWTAIESQSFTINRFEVSGNKLLPTDFILISLRDYYGDERSRSDINQIRNDVISLYQMSGYSKVKVNLPKQVDNDTIAIQIDENRIRH